MTSERYAILGVGRPRSIWFTNVATWATSGAVPADFSKCLSVDDARQRLNGLQPFSVLLAEVGIAGVDRDLIDTARRAGVPTIFITDDNDSEWSAAGASTLSRTHTPAQLMHALATRAQSVGDRTNAVATAVAEHPNARQGRLIAVCGAGGAGTSTIATAVAQAVASDITEAGHVVLADFARNGEQAMLHDSPDIVPGVEELVELHRHKRPSLDVVRAQTFAVHARGYRLLLGRRRSSAWTSMTSTTVSASITSLRSAFRTVVADITADFEGETATGSMDIEERNALSRTSVLDADLVLVVGTAGMKGVHSLVAVTSELATAGVPADRIVPVINRSSKRSTDRAELTRVVATLARAGTAPTTVNAPIFVPERPLEDALRSGDPLPHHVVGPLTTAIDLVAQLAEEHEDGRAASIIASRVAPGSLGIVHDEASGQ